MPNVVFGETSGNDIPLEYGLQARKHFIKHNKKDHLFIEIMNKKIPMLNDSQSFHK